MGIKVATRKVLLDEVATKEYSLLMDGVIELKCHTNKKMFFDGLLDAVIAYVEQHNGLTALAMSYKEYEYTNEDEIEVNNGQKIA